MILFKINRAHNSLRGTCVFKKKYILFSIDLIADTAFAKVGSRFIKAAFEKKKIL